MSIKMSIKLLSNDLLKLIASFLIKPKYKLLDWIPEKSLSTVYLSMNPNAVQLLEQRMNEIYWPWLSLNPNAMHIIEQNMSKILMGVKFKFTI